MESQRCKAVAKSTGKQCTRPAIPGAVVCRFHGGAAPQVKAKAAGRVALAEALANGDRRPAAEILLDAMATTDHLMRETKLRVIEGELLTPEALDGLISATGRAAAMARVVLDADIEARERRLDAGMVAEAGEWLRESVAVPYLTSVQQKEILKRWATLARGQNPEPLDWSRPAVEAPRPGRPVRRSPPSPSPGPVPEPFVPEAPARADAGPVVEDAVLVDEAPVRAHATVGLALAARCPGCGEPAGPAHDQECGWSHVAARAGGAK